MVELSIINNASIYSFVTICMWSSLSAASKMNVCYVQMPRISGTLWKYASEKANRERQFELDEFICAEYQLIGFGCIFSFDMLMELGENFVGHGYIIDRSRAVRFINVLFTCKYQSFICIEYESKCEQNEWVRERVTENRCVCV